MIQRILFKILMSPFALLYGIGVSVRNWFYNIGFLKSISFGVPVISIGNLTVGGAGKSPHIEYLVGWLSQYLEIAVLSRGYKRKTKGFLPVSGYNTADQVGDEPLQFKRKFAETSVYVSESRVIGIPKILSQTPDTQLILLDDAFQHRSVKPGLNILLTEYDHPYTKDFLLPMGRLREWRFAANRADIVLVTKCPPSLDDQEKATFVDQLNLQGHQSVFFTKYQYLRPYHFLYPSVSITLQPPMNALVVSAIARTDYLLHYLEGQLDEVRTIEYEDHHDFSRYEVAQIKEQFDKWDVEHKVLITTQKDAVRLEKHVNFIREHELPIFVLPVQVTFLGGEDQFQDLVKGFLLDFKS